MSYETRFHLVDNFINHLDIALINERDEFIKSRYIGFLSVMIITTYELAIKDIFCEFADKKHKVLGNFARGYFERINGQIAKKVIVERYIPKFGQKYVRRFIKKLEKKEKINLRSKNISIKSSYSNLITWRNQFAHQGQIPSTATYDEVKKSFVNGRVLIDCLAESMIR